MVGLMIKATRVQGEYFSVNVYTSRIAKNFASNTPFRSGDLRVMSPAHFPCAMLLYGCWYSNFVTFKVLCAWFHWQSQCMRHINVP
jgi:hypothetical protein